MNAYNVKNIYACLAPRTPPATAESRQQIGAAPVAYREPGMQSNQIPTPCGFRWRPQCNFLQYIHKRSCVMLSVASSERVSKCSFLIWGRGILIYRARQGLWQISTISANLFNFGLRIIMYMYVSMWRVGGLEGGWVPTIIHFHLWFTRPPYILLHSQLLICHSLYIFPSSIIFSFLIHFSFFSPSLSISIQPYIVHTPPSTFAPNHIIFTFLVNTTKRNHLPCIYIYFFFFLCV